MWGVFVPSDVIIIMLLLISVFFVFNLLIEILLSESCTLSSIYIFYYFWLNSIFEENSWQSHTPDWLRIHLVIISDIKFANTVHNLGVCLDPTLSFQQQISSVCRICYLELRSISAIRHYLSEDVTKKLLCAFVLSIIIMEICKAPTLRLKALNKHTHIMYIEMENVIKKREKISTRVQA